MTDTQQQERREAIRDRRQIAEMHLSHIGRLRGDLERAFGAFERAREASRKFEADGDVQFVDAARDAFWESSDALAGARSQVAEAEREFADAQRAGRSA